MPEGEYQLFMKGLKGNTTIIIIKKDATIKELRETVSDETGIPDEEIRLLYCSKDLQSEDAHGKIQTLEDYNIQNEGHLCLVFRLVGGSDNGKQPKLYDAEVELTDLPDMFTLDDDARDKRSKMPCGHADATIKELRETVSDETGIPDEEIRLLYCSKDLQSEDAHGKIQTLEDYNIQNEGHLCLVFRLVGGSDNGKQPKLYDAEVELTDLPDMFTLDDDARDKRSKMPCGHAVGPASLTAYCRSLLTAGKYEFRCPYKKSPDQPFCDSMWEFFTVKRLAVLTDSELKEFEIKIADNYLRKAVGIQDCPRCKSYCERIDKTDIRVICPVCTRATKKLYEFCWYCLKTWLLSGTTDCGNASCAGVDPRMKIVKECPRITVVKVPNCPAVRACPTCGLLIEHKSGCKQMTCPCGQKFCFICLKTASELGRYSCGAWNFKCEVAPIQTTIPGN